MTAPAEDPRGREVPTHEHGRWCLVGCDEGGSAPLPPADLSHFAARPAGDRAQPTQEQREAIAQGYAKWTAAPYPPDQWQINNGLDLADALLAGPLAALLDAQAAVSRVEAVIEIAATSERFGKPKVRGYQTPAMREVLAMLRRALDGT